MNWDAIGAVSELVGALGVIASLLYVARQIGLNTRAMRAAAHQKSIDSYMDIGHLLLRDDLLDVFRVGTEDPEALNEADKGRFALATHHLLRTFEGVHSQYRMGMLDKEVWDGWLKFYADYCVAPGILWYWEMRRDTFPLAFRELVDSLKPRSGAVRLEGITAGTGEPTEPSEG